MFIRGKLIREKIEYFSLNSSMAPMETRNKEGKIA